MNEENLDESLEDKLVWVIKQLKIFEERLIPTGYRDFQLIKDRLLECIETIYNFQNEFLNIKNVEIIDEEIAFFILGKLRKWLKNDLY